MSASGERSAEKSRSGSVSMEATAAQQAAVAQPFALPAGRVIIAAVVGLAGLIHLSLIPEHFAEQLAYGPIFTTLAVFQLILAWFIAIRPGPTVYRVGIWGSGLIVLTYVVTRFIPLANGDGLQGARALEIVATSLEIVAVLLLALALPDPARPSRRRGTSWWWGVGGAIAFLLIWLIMTGEVQWTSTLVLPLSLTWTGPLSWSGETPTLIGSPLPHILVAAPLWSLPTALVLATLVGLNLWFSTKMLAMGSTTARGRRARLFTLLPAGLALPVCCSASTPLLGLLGLPLVLGVVAAPFAAWLSAVLLVLSLVSLRARSKRLWAVCAPNELCGAPDMGEKATGSATTAAGDLSERRS